MPDNYFPLDFTCDLGEDERKKHEYRPHDLRGASATEGGERGLSN